MHLTHLILALVAATPAPTLYAPITPVAAVSGTPERWEDYGRNPTWEVYGAEDGAGVFRYSAMRRKSQTSVSRNYGVNLSAHAPSPGAPVIMGTDGETAKSLLHNSPTLRESTPKEKEADQTFLSWASGIMSGGIGATKPCAHSDCPDGQCDRKPKPPLNPFKKKPPISIPQFAFLEPMHLAWIGVGLIVLVAVGTCLVLLMIAAVFAVKYALSKRPPS